MGPKNNNFIIINSSFGDTSCSRSGSSKVELRNNKSGRFSTNSGPISTKISAKVTSSSGLSEYSSSSGANISSRLRSAKRIFSTLESNPDQAIGQSSELPVVTNFILEQLNDPAAQTSAPVRRSRSKSLVERQTVPQPIRPRGRTNSSGRNTSNTGLERSPSFQRDCATPSMSSKISLLTPQISDLSTSREPNSAPLASSSRQNILPLSAQLSLESQVATVCSSAVVLSETPFF